MSERVPAPNKTSTTPSQATQSSSPLLGRQLTSELSESVGSSSNISQELGGIQPKTIRRSLNWQNISVEASSRGNGMSLPGSIQRQQEEQEETPEIQAQLAADSAQKSALESSNLTISTSEPAQKPLIARAPFNGRNIPVEASPSSASSSIHPGGIQRQESSDEKEGKELIDTVNQDAQDIIGGTGKNQRRRMAATARASSPEPGTMTSHFENIKPPGNTEDFPGFQVKDKLDDQLILTVRDPNKFMDELKKMYTEQGTTLHPKLEEKIRNYVSEEGRTLSSRDGVPGLHAEVQAVNAHLHKLTEKGEEITDEIFAQTQVATYRVTPNPKEMEGKPFPACHNCTNILHDTNILTGVIEE